MNWTPSRSKRSGLTRLWKLKPSTRLCNDFYVFDIETAHRKRNSIFKDSSKFKGELNWQLKATPESFVFGCIYGHNYNRVIHSVDEFKRVLLEPRFKGKTLFAHNAQYDLNGIYGNIYDLDPEAIFNGKFIMATNGNCTFADSMNIFIGMGVKELGQLMGNEKLGMSNDYSKSVWPKDYARDVNGCFKDCQIVWDALFKTFEFAGEIRITQASLSMVYYRRFHQPFHIDHNEMTKHFWPAYYGGRNEVFKLGKTHSSCIDINSSYPYHTRNGRLPNPKTLKHELDFPVKKLKKYLEWFEGCADMTIIHHETEIGFLPFKKDGKLLFPNGRFRGSWTFPEIRFALKHKAITVERIHSITYGEPIEGLFTGFIDHLHEMKLDGQSSGNLMAVSMAKYFMNMFYGKFGQRIDEESIYIRDIEKQFHIIQDYQRKKLFKKLIPFSGKRNDAMLIIGKRKQKAVPYAIPCFAAYITAYGRLQLLEKMLAMKHNKIVYCDTDSIFFEIMTPDIKSENHLGGWKLEDKIITEIKGLKNYKYINTKGNEVWRIKGVPVIRGRKIRIFTDEKETEVNAVEQINEKSFRYFNLMKSKEALRRGKEPGILTERIKEIKNTYDKRVIFADGNTKPIIL